PRVRQRSRAPALPSPPPAAPAWLPSSVSPTPPHVESFAPRWPSGPTHYAGYDVGQGGRSVGLSVDGSGPGAGANLAAPSGHVSRTLPDRGVPPRCGSLGTTTSLGIAESWRKRACPRDQNHVRDQAT